MSSNVIVERNLVFGQTDREYLTADVFLPSDGDDFPAVLLIHGGAFQSGSKEMYAEWGPYLAKNGLAAIAINYRLTTESYATWPGVMDDVRAGVNWVVSKAHEWKINPLKLGVMGDSAGAHLAMQFLLTHPANASYKIQAAVGVYGVYDLTERMQTDTENASKFEKLFGAPYEEASERYREASPINYIESAAANPVFDTSFFIIWGETDKVVSPDQSKAFATKLEEAGLETKRLAIPDKGHFWFNLLPNVEGCSLADYPNTVVAPQVLSFLKEKLSPPEVGNFSMKRIQQLKALM